MPVVTVWDTNSHKGPHCPFTGAITDQFLRILQETLCASTIISYYIYGHISVQGFIIVSMDVTWSLVKFSLKIYGKTIPLLVKKYILKVL